MGTPIEPGEVQGGDENTPGPNPAWNDVLSVIPEQFHSVVTPHFQQWDQSAQQRIETVNQQLSQYDPYKPFVENGISADVLGQGVQFLEQLNQNPKAVYEALAEAYGFGAQPQGQNPQGEIDDDDDDDPYGQRFEQLNQGLELVAQTVLGQHQERVQREAEQQLDADLKAAVEKHGAFDEGYVLSLMAANEGVDLDTAIQSYQQMAQNILQQNPRPFAPTVMGNSAGGTGLPSQAIDPRKLDGKATRDLVAQMLEAANRDG